MISLKSFNSLEGSRMAVFIVSHRLLATDRLELSTSTPTYGGLLNENVRKDVLITMHMQK